MTSPAQTQQWGAADIFERLLHCRVMRTTAGVVVGDCPRHRPAGSMLSSLVTFSPGGRIWTCPRCPPPSGGDALTALCAYLGLPDRESARTWLQAEHGARPLLVDPDDPADMRVLWDDIDACAAERRRRAG